MKIYFAGSIRGGRSDADLYHRLIACMKRTDTVLTEHVGDLHLQESTEAPDIYAQDTAWLRESDLVIAECSCPSLGVGYELAYAERFGKPVHIFCRKGIHLSAMLTGDPYFRIYSYEDEAELYPLLDQILKKAREA